MDVAVGHQYEVIRINASCKDSYRQKLLAMGFTPGVRFCALKRAPFKGPIAIRLRGFMLSLRPLEFRCLDLKEVG